MGLQKQEVLAQLQQGSFDIIRAADPSSLKELAALGPEAPFYAGLKLFKLGDKERAIAALSTGTESLPLWAEQTRYKTLIPLLIETKQTETALDLMKKLGKQAQYREQNWYRSLLTETYFAGEQYKEIVNLQKTYTAVSMDLRERGLVLFSRLALEPENKNILTEIQNFFFTGSISDIQRDLFAKIQQAPHIYLPQTVVDAIRGRLYIADRSYGDALYYLKQALSRNRYLFEAYLELLSDLGKAYQYSGAAKEGIRLFIDWDATIVSGQNTKALITSGDKNEIRFKLFFYAARMARQIKAPSDALNYFYKALPLAPDPQQRDACIWYILDTSLETEEKDFAATLESLIPIWFDPSYFDDLLDKICTSYTTNHKWQELLRVFKIIYQKADSPTKARYAYILARAFTESYLSPSEELEFLGFSSESKPAAIAERLYTIAFDTDKASYYYRSLAAAFLGTKLQVIPGKTDESDEKNKISTSGDEKSLMAYLAGYFTWGCADIALPYILEYREQLKPEEIRWLAALFGSSGRWGEQIQLIYRALLNRKDYTLQRADFELLYPLPFRDLMEPIAKQHRIPLEIFYGLVRSESAFVPDVTSHAGAKGLTQLMLATAKDAAWRIKRAGGPDFAITDAKDLENPETNLYIGAWYLAYLIERTGSPLLALASYNGGMTRVRNWKNSQSKLVEDLFLETIPITETREYSRKVLGAAAVYGYLYFNMSMEAVFADIFPVQQHPLEAR
ncbi:flagellar assembly lytic transglycosylase [Gracilinema caldarium]|uniref:flagellar assembly lytic transglycosylase n=1 Tax=Gracilinema caldarium TaxID=215591 RepID=UPI0026F2E3FB|nr:lytic transglycosylase domain-containing protein [Gracilinema caldarium]